MAEGKWIRDLTPTMPVVEAARLVLQQRLEPVGQYLFWVLREKPLDPEHVHQLRVSTRRADAALRIFRDCLPRRSYRRARARLRAIRRAAGAARDWDVFLLEITQRSKKVSAAELPGLDFLIGVGMGHRQEAQLELESIEEGQPERFAPFAAEIVQALRLPDEDQMSCLKDLATWTVERRLTALDEAAAGDLKDYAQLHQVRIAGKRLRYAMEVLSDCFPPPFRETLYPMIEQMQETLGRANDSHVASQRLAILRELLRAWPKTWGRVRNGIEALMRYHQRRLSQERRRFLKWWDSWKAAREEILVS